MFLFVLFSLIEKIKYEKNLKCKKKSSKSFFSIP